MIWRVIFEECPHQESRQVVSRKNCDKFRKYQMFLFTLLPDDSVSRACHVSQTVRWRFGTIHRGITKPFLLAWRACLTQTQKSELSRLPYFFSSQQKNVNKKKKKKVENFGSFFVGLGFSLIKTFTSKFWISRKTRQKSFLKFKRKLLLKKLSHWTWMEPFYKLARWQCWNTYQKLRLQS